MTLNAPVFQSLLLHGILGGLFVLLYFLNPSYLRPKERIKIEIKEVYKPQETIPEKAPPIQTALQPKPAVPAAEEPKKIFGINKNTLTDDSNENAVAIKAGNTLAKEVDQEKLTPEDAQSLPLPTDEYLVSKMPKLKSEIQIPYPPEARKNNIEGLVVLEILIDESGKVRSATLIEGPGYGLNEAALEAIYQFEFSPALVDEKPVAVKIRYGYRFVLN